MVELNLNNLFKTARYISLTVTFIATVLAVILPDPEKQKQVLGYIFTVARPHIDTPTIIVLIICGWILYLICLVGHGVLLYNSDRLLTEGADRTYSCTASKFHPTGDFGYIGAGGIKLIGYEGSTAVINPLTHIHKVANTIWMEAHVTPNTDLSDTPPEMKRDIIQRSKGFFGFKDCSVGFLSSKEKQENVTFDGSKYDEARTADDKKVHTTSTFILKIMSSIKAIHPLFLFLEDDTQPIERKLASIKKIGNAATNSDQKGGLDWLRVK